MGIGIISDNLVIFSNDKMLGWLGEVTLRYYIYIYVTKNNSLIMS